MTKISWLKWHNGLSADVSDLRPVMTITFSVRLSILRLKSTKSTSNFEFLKVVAHRSLLVNSENGTCSPRSRTLSASRC